MTAPGTGCRSSRRGAADRGERIREPGRRADRDPPCRRPARGDADGPPRGHRARAADVAGSTSCSPTTRAAGAETPPTRGSTTPSATSSRSPRPNGDFAAAEGTWEILLKCGDPSIAEVGATFSTETTKNGWFGMPNNCAIDADGRLWVATDGNSPGETGRTDGLWAIGPEGDGHATSRLFYRVPVGAELCGPGRRPISRPSSSRSSIRATAATTGKASGGRPTSRMPRPVGPTSPRECRCAPRSSRSPGRAAARSAQPDARCARLRSPDRSGAAALTIQS